MAAEIFRKIPLEVSVQKAATEAVVRRCSSRYVIGNISQILHEITPVSKSLYNQVAGPRPRPAT